MSPGEKAVRLLVLCLIVTISVMSARTTWRINEINEEVLMLRERRSDAEMRALMNHRPVMRGITLDDYLASRLELESSRLKIWETLWFMLFWLQLPVPLLIDRFFRRRRSALNFGTRPFRSPPS